MRENYRMVAISVMTLLSLQALLVALPQNVSAAGEATETHLYLHGPTERILNTIPPNPSGGDLAQFLTAGSSVNFTIQYPLTESWDIGGFPDGANEAMRLHLASLTYFTTTADFVLNASVYEDRNNGAPIRTAFGSFPQDEFGSGYFNLTFDSTGGSTLSAGSGIRLVIELGGGTGSLESFYFTFYGADESSYISFLGDPIPEDGVNVRMEDSNGNEIDEVLSNGPEEARRINFTCSAVDALGAYDLSELKLSMEGGGGAEIFNATTDQPAPGGGARTGYFNYTYTLPEQIPVGTYNVTVEAASNTGQRVDYTTTLEVVAGLYVTLLDSSVREVDAGDTARFGIRVVNGGDTSDRISFAGSTSKGWDLETPQPQDLDHGDSVELEFRVVVPFTATTSEECDVEMEVRSENTADTYRLKGRIHVRYAATFGLEVVGSPALILHSGTTGNYSLTLTNLANSSRGFELWVEDLPMEWSHSFNAEGGGQGSRYEVEVEGKGEKAVGLSLSIPLYQSNTVEEIKVLASPDVDSEERYVILTVSVIDPGTPVISSTTTEHSSHRKGTSYPITYSEVIFDIDLYNPGLEEQDLDFYVEGPEGWEIIPSDDTYSLSPGEGRTVDLSMTPRPGEIWKEGGYEIGFISRLGKDVERVLNLNVNLDKIVDIQLLAEPEKTSIQADEGGTVPFNITLKNRGNTHEKVQIYPDNPPLELELELQTDFFDMGPGSENEAKGTLILGDVKDDTLLTLVVASDLEGEKGGKLTVTIQILAVDDSMDLQFLYWVIPIGAAVLLIAIVAYMNWKKTAPKPVKKEEKAKVTPAVEITSETKRGAIGRRTKPIREPPDKEIFKRADDISLQILNEKREVERPEVIVAEIKE